MTVLSGHSDHQQLLDLHPDVVIEKGATAPLLTPAKTYEKSDLITKETTEKPKLRDSLPNNRSVLFKNVQVVKDKE